MSAPTKLIGPVRSDFENSNLGISIFNDYEYKNILKINIDRE